MRPPAPSVVQRTKVSFETMSECLYGSSKKHARTENVSVKRIGLCKRAIHANENDAESKFCETVYAYDEIRVHLCANYNISAIFSYLNLLL